MPVDKPPRSTIPANDIGDGVSNMASQVASKASDLGRKAVDKLDDSRSSAAGGLESAARKLDASADSFPGGKTVSDAAHAAASGISSTADYIRDHDMETMMSDLQQLVKNNPGPALLVAGLLGFLIARALPHD